MLKVCTNETTTLHVTICTLIVGNCYNRFQR